MTPDPDAPSNPATRTTGDAAGESVLIVPLGAVFAPARDPSIQHPDEAADVEGYLLAPDRRLSVALAAGGAGAGALLEELWSSLEERQVGERRWTRTDDQGRRIAVLTVRLPDGARASELLRRTLVLPVRVRAGFAEVHLLADPADALALQEELAHLGARPSSISPGGPASTARGGGLTAEDWALMGLLQAVGVFDPRDAPGSTAVADVVGVPASLLAERVRSLEEGLRELVSTLFAPVGGPTPAAR